MKIYPSQHKIKSITDNKIDLDLNIPLAYVEVDHSSYDKKHVFEESVTNDSLTSIYPNQSFYEIPLIFNQFKERLDTENLFSRVGDKYFYRPINLISFKPQKFNYTATIKKASDYKSNNAYNINIACIDDPDTLSLSQKLAAVFSTPSLRNVTAPNISINKDRADAQSFSDITNEECDILFVKESADDDPIISDINIFLDKHTSVWIASDYNRTYPHESIHGGYSFRIKNTVLNNEVRGTATTYFNYSELPYNPGVIYHNLFDGNRIPVVVIEHIGKGYEIISTDELIDNIESQIQVIYECVAFCYFNSYKSTPELTQWITSTVPDYQIEDKALIKKKYFLSDIDIYKHFSLNQNELNLYSVQITDSDENSANRNDDIDLFDPSSMIEFTGLNGGRLMFDRKGIENIYNNEPEKPLGWISIYDGENVIYLSQVHYLVETDLRSKVFSNIKDNRLEVKILNFKSSSIKSDMETPRDIVIDFIIADVNGTKRVKEAEYVFYINEAGISYNYSEEYDESMGKKLFSIQIAQSSNAIKVTDMRSVGGGTKEINPTNFDLLDVGHIDGRPYRQAGTIVFTFPTRFKEYESDIKTAIDKYISATELAVILFEDK